MTQRRKHTIRSNRVSLAALAAALPVVSGFAAPAFAQTPNADVSPAQANAAANALPPPPAKVRPPSTVPAVPLPQSPTPAPALPIAVGGPVTITPAPAAPTFTLQQTIQAALKSSSDLQIANANLDRDAARVDEARSQGRPQINSQDTYQHLDKPVVIAIGGGPPVVAEAQDKEFLTLNGSLPVDIFGRIRATTDVARLQLLADRFQRDRIYNDRVLYAEQTYFNLLRAEHQVAVAQSALQNALAQQTIAQRQFSGGVGQRIDFLRAQSQTATAQQNLESAQNNLTIQQSNFNDLLGRPLGAPVAAVDAPGVTTGTAVSADVNNITTALTAPPPTFFVPNTQQPVSLDQGITLAQRQRPELLADQVNVQAASRQIYVARTGNYPTVSLNATGDYYPTTDFQTPRHSLGVYTVTLNIPIYDGGRTHDQVREARDAEQVSRITFSNDQTNVELQVRQAYANLQTAAQQITSANAALQEAIAARQLAQVRYANGVGLYLEVTDAEAALTQAETNQVNAVYNYLTARAQYENAIGAPQLNPQI